MRISHIVSAVLTVAFTALLGAQARTADQNDVALVFAIQEGHEKEALRLLNGGADVDAVFGSQLKTVLMDAVTSHSTNIFHYLLDHGAKLDTVDHHGMTALMLAVSCRETPFVEALLDKGANPDVIGDYHSSALMIAAECGFVDIVQRLIKGGANVNLKNASGSTALLRATAKKHEPVIQLLRNAGAQEVRAKETLALEDAVQLMKEITLLNQTIEQVSSLRKRTETKTERPPLQWKDLQQFLPPDAPLRARQGNDPLGTPYQIHPGKGGADVARATFAAVVDLIKNNPVPVLQNKASGKNDTASQAADKKLAEETGKRMQAVQLELIQMSKDMEATIERGDKDGAAALQVKATRLGTEYHTLHVTLAKLSQSDSFREPSPRDLAVHAVQAGDFNRIIGSERHTPLAVAAAGNDMELLAHLLFSGVDPNIHEKGYEAPLHVAARYPVGNVLTVKLLLEFGADPNVRTRNGDTPMHLAIEKPAVMNVLLEYGADPFMKNDEGNTPYMQIHTFYGDCDLSKCVLEKAMGKEASAIQVSALLHGAVRAWNKRRMKTLLERGANVNLTPPGAKSMIQVAVEANQVDMVQMLMAAGAQVKDINVEPPLLCYAAWRENEELVRLLIEHGAPIHERNTEGRTALELAQEKGNKEIIKALMAAGAGEPTGSTVTTKDPRAASVIQTALMDRLADIRNQKPSLVNLPVVNTIHVNTLSLPEGFMPEIEGLSFERVDPCYATTFMANPSGIFLKSITVHFTGKDEASVTVDYICDCAPLKPRIRSQVWNYRIERSGEAWTVKRATCTSAR